MKFVLLFQDVADLKIQKTVDSGKKGAKKRKKKTLTEPQKPVSAYALFFKYALPLNLYQFYKNLFKFYIVPQL